ncbi:MAG: hypothetical protein ACQET8_05295 [Bacillota bacterium]
MKKKGFVGISMFFLSYLIIFMILNAYSLATTPEKHTEWLEEYGWKRDFYFSRKQAFTIPSHSESLNTYQSADVRFKGYEDNNLVQHIYRLKEKCGNRYLEAVLLTSDDKIVNSYIKMSQTDPGIVKMMYRPQFMDKICK